MPVSALTLLARRAAAQSPRHQSGVSRDEWQRAAGSTRERAAELPRAVATAIGLRAGGNGA